MAPSPPESGRKWIQQAAVPLRKPVPNSKSNAWAQESDEERNAIWNMEYERNAAAIHPLHRPRDGFGSHREQLRSRKSENSWAQDASPTKNAKRSVRKDMGLAISLPNPMGAPKPSMSPPKAAKEPKKDRPVAESSSSKSDLLTRMMSSKSLKSVFGSEKSAAKVSRSSSTKSKKSEDTTPPLPPLPSDKANRLLGLSSLHISPKQYVLQAPASAKELTTPHVYQEPSFEKWSASRRQAISNPAGVKTPEGDEEEAIPSQSIGYSRPPPDGFLKPCGMVFGNGNMSPTKLGSYGTINRTALNDNHFARVVSHRGLIETTEEEKVKEAPSHNTCSPSVYERVWEKNPRVNDSLPPFSPAQVHLAEQYGELIGRPDHRSYTPSPVTPLLRPSPLSPTVNFGDGSFIGRSSAGVSKVQESAEVLPLFTSQNTSQAMNHVQYESLPTTMAGENSVPPPPASFTRSQRSGPTEISQVAMAIHHHVDVAFDRLTRMITSKIDRVHDEVIRRTELLEERIAKIDKDVPRQYLSALSNEFEILGHDLRVGATSGTENKRLLHSIVGELKAVNRRMLELEGAVNDGACKCERPKPQDNTHETAPIMQQRQPTFFDGYQELTMTAPNEQMRQQRTESQTDPDHTHRGNAQPFTAYQDQSHNYGFRPRSRQFSEDYYQSFRNPQIMSVNVPEVSMQDHPVLDDSKASLALGVDYPNGSARKLQGFMLPTTEGPVIKDDSPKSTSDEETLVNSTPESCVAKAGSTVSHSLRGPYGVSYELPSFMQATEDGPVVINHEAKVEPVPVGMRGLDGTLFEIPSFATVDAVGNVVLDDFGNGIALSTGTTDIQQTSAVGTIEDVYEVQPFMTVTNSGHIEVEGPEGMTYELTSFTTVTENGQTEVRVQEDTVAEETVPFGIEGPDGVIYDIPASMQMNLDGLAELIHQNKHQAEQNLVVIDVNDNPIGIRLNGLIYDVPSFMSINRTGNAEIILDAMAAETETHPGETFPMGIRGPNGCLYELPTFMRVDESGMAQVISSVEPSTLGWFADETGKSEMASAVEPDTF